MYKIVKKKGIIEFYPTNKGLLIKFSNIKKKNFFYTLIKGEDLWQLWYNSSFIKTPNLIIKSSKTSSNEKLTIEMRKHFRKKDLEKEEISDGQEGAAENFLKWYLRFGISKLTGNNEYTPDFDRRYRIWLSPSNVYFIKMMTEAALNKIIKTSAFVLDQEDLALPPQTEIFECGSMKKRGKLKIIKKEVGRIVLIPTDKGFLLAFEDANKKMKYEFLITGNALGELIYHTSLVRYPDLTFRHKNDTQEVLFSIYAKKGEIVYTKSMYKSGANLLLAQDLDGEIKVGDKIQIYKWYLKIRVREINTQEWKDSRFFLTPSDIQKINLLAYSTLDVITQAGLVKNLKPILEPVDYTQREGYIRIQIEK